jgi:fused signal recognition particle receptor
MNLGENAYEFENRKSVVLVIGVNGVGKTTSVGKLAGQLKDQGKKVILAAADTFRAAAIEQLTEWAGRAGVDLIAQQEGSDPAAVIYDAIAAAKSIFTAAFINKVRIKISGQVVCITRKT